MVGPVSDGLVSRRGNTLFGVSVAETAALHYEVIDGKVSGGRGLARRGCVLGLARARLALQQSDADVGHSQLLLALLPKRIQGLPLWKGTVDHLSITAIDPIWITVMSQDSMVSLGGDKTFTLISKQDISLDH